MSAKIIILRANPLNPDPSVEKIARALTEQGYLISLLGWDMNGDLPQVEDVAGYKVYRLRIYVNFGRGLSNVRHQLRWQIALLSWLVRHRWTYDLIHACDFDTVLPALICRLFWKKPVIYDIFDFYADMLRLTPEVVRRLIRYFDLKCIDRVDAVILVTLPKIRWGLLYGAILLNARPIGEFGAVSVVSGHVRGVTNTAPLHVEILYNEYNFVAAFAVASILAMLALLTLAAKALVEWRANTAS